MLAIPVSHVIFLSGRPESAKELFNLRHAQLRNIIERMFSILKKCFLILNTAPQYSIKQHVNLVVALMVVSNFITLEGSGVGDIIADEWDAEQAADMGWEQIAGDEEAIDDVDDLHNRIADEMWTDYRSFVSEREQLRQQRRALALRL